MAIVMTTSPNDQQSPTDAYANDIHESSSHEPLFLHMNHTDPNPTPTENDSGGTCGWSWFRPKCLQQFRTSQWVLFWLCWTGFLQGLTVNGFINVVITTIERRFELSSTESGLIAGGYDIASFLCLIPISYFGGTRSKPLFIGIGAFVLGLGSLVFSLPHFLADSYSFSEEHENVCPMFANSNATCTLPSTGHLSNFKYVFLLGQLLHGAGAAPFYTLGCTYIDENVATRMSALYLGIYYTMAVVGPAVGYLVGGQFLLIYTDLFVDTKVLGLTPASSVWVGAWWIGFLIAATIGFFIAIPLTAFPKTLPGYLKVNSRKVSEMHKKLENSAATKSGFGSTIQDLPSSFRFLITNPTFVFLSLAGATEGMLVSGLATFLPKVIESQFSIASSWAAVLVGLVTIPGAGGGTFLGGYLIKKFNMHCAAIIKMCIVFSFICVGLVFIFILHCPNPKFAGLNTPIYNSSGLDDQVNFIAPCNENCGCDPYNYDPVCGTNNIMYFSPCLAGCSEVHDLDGIKVYDNCKCINEDYKNATVDDNVIRYQARRQKCTNNCSYMPVFLLVIFLSMLFTFLVSMPSLSATLRCVAESQKSFALGIQWITVRLVGTIPSPILFGSLIDMSCVLWQKTCGTDGSCLFYDNRQLSTNVLILACIQKSLSCVFFFFAWLLYKSPNKPEPTNRNKASLPAAVEGS